MSADSVIKNEDKQRILLKDNLLVKTKYELTLAENRLHNLLMYKFQKEGNNLRCVISLPEIKEVIKNKELNTIKGVHAVLEGLSEKKINIQEVKSNGINSKWHHYNFIDGFTFDDEYNTFEVKATEEIYELLKKKFEGGGYTPSNLNIFLSLKNYYAQRLYDLLRLWSGSKSIINYTVDDLKGYLMLETQYPEYGNFKRRVLIPAIKELNKSGCFKIEMKEVKNGRKVKSIDFIVEDLDKRIYFKSEIIKPYEVVEKNKLLDLDSPKTDCVNKNLEFYVPNKKLFTAKTLESFKNDFKDYNFRDSNNKKALQVSIMATLEKDDEEKIKVKAYEYFKVTLKDQLSKLYNKVVSGDKKVKTRYHNINQTYLNYSEDELEKILQESQKYKFNEPSTKHAESEFGKIVLDQPDRSNVSNNLTESYVYEEIFNEAVKLLQEEIPCVKIDPNSTAWKKVIEDKIKELISA